MISKVKVGGSCRLSCRVAATLILMRPLAWNAIKLVVSTWFNLLFSTNGKRWPSCEWVGGCRNFHLLFFVLLRFFFAIFTFGHSMSFYNAAVRYHNGMSDCGCSQIVHLAATFSTGSTEHDIRMQGMELAPKIFWDYGRVRGRNYLPSRKW